MRVLDQSTHLLTRALHRIRPTIPVVDRWPGASSILYSLYRRLVRPAYDAVTWRLAVLHRARLEDAVFIGVTGSAGKTMTKLLVTKVLATRLRGGSTSGTQNNVRSVVRSLLYHARKGDQFHVVELSAFPLDVIGRQLRLLRPRIGIMTNIGTDHHSAFGSMEAIAAHKGRLIRSLPRDGIAVLNADDPRVLPMREWHQGRVMTFGLNAEATVTARDISAAWPDPLSFDVTYKGQTVRVQTQLFGTQWVSAVLAAIATGLALDVPLEAAAQAIGEVKPNPGRMSPVFLADGMVCMRDDWKASVHTVAPALEFLRTARAKRKIAVVGTISDSFGSSGPVYAKTARHALEVADAVCFVGPCASFALRAQPKDRPERLQAFGTREAAERFLATFLEPGDLILLKGSEPADHLDRLTLARTPRADPSESPGSAGSMTRIEEEKPRQVLIGLGNPGEDYRGTPHNVGQAVLDRLAERLNVAWGAEPDATVARTEWQGQPLLLVKPSGWINHSGRALLSLSDRLGFLPEHCILVYDDIALPLGAVRTRMRGSHGGHRGVRSILEAFQTDQFRRVKIGVQRPGDESSATDAVLRVFSDHESETIDTAVEQAQKNLSDLLTLKPAP